jgi:hypothetical protein
MPALKQLPRLNGTAFVCDLIPSCLRQICLLTRGVGGSPAGARDRRARAGGATGASPTGPACCDGAAPPAACWRQGDAVCTRSSAAHPTTAAGGASSGPAQRRTSTGARPWQPAACGGLVLSHGPADCNGRSDRAHSGTASSHTRRRAWIVSLCARARGTAMAAEGLLPAGAERSAQLMACESCHTVLETFRGIARFSLGRARARIADDERGGQFDMCRFECLALDLTQEQGGRHAPDLSQRLPNGG